MTDEEIKSIIINAPLDNAKDLLIDKAKELGGDDNITVALGKIVS